MTRYHRLGEIPSKRHITFTKPDGSLYYEQLVSTEGFSSVYSLTYHVHRPTRVLEMGQTINVAPKFLDNSLMVNRSFEGFKVAASDDFLESRKVVLGNDHTLISLAAPTQSMSSYFFKNVDFIYASVLIAENQIEEAILHLLAANAHGI